MEIEEIRALIKDMIALMEENGLSELEIDSEGVRVKLKKGAEGGAPVTSASPQVSSLPAGAPESAAAPEEEKALVEITSPIVGTFYRAAGPDTEAFVEIGSTLEPETTVCIIEAMKVMNEIKAEVEGRIVEILVSNGEAVEFGQPLFRVDVSA